MLTALRDDNEFNLTRLRGLLKVANYMTISILRTADAWWVQTADRRGQNRHHRDHHRASCWPTAPPIDAAAAQHATRCRSTASSCSRR